MTEQVAVFRLDDGAQHEVLSAGNMAAAKQMAAAPAAKASPRAAAPALKPATKTAAKTTAETAAKPAAKPAVVTAATSKAASGMNGRGPVGQMQTALAVAIKDGPAWEEF